jgi:hypothetical protein
MTLRLPGQRSLNMLSKKADRDAALRGCLHHGPRRIYAGLLHHAREQGHKDGLAYYAFIEIFGTRPRPQDQQGPPLPPPPELAAWISLRPKRSKNR